MAFLNKVMLIGNVGSIEVRKLETGKVALVSLATTERYKDRNGERRDDTTWHNLVVYGKLAPVVEKYVQKGSSIYIEGRIRRSKYTDRDGNERVTNEIVVDSLKLLDARRDSDRSDTRDDMGF